MQSGKLADAHNINKECFDQTTSTDIKVHNAISYFFLKFKSESTPL